MYTFIGLKMEVQIFFFILCFDLQRFNKTHLYAHLIKREIMNISIKSQNHGKYGKGEAENQKVS